MKNFILRKAKTGLLFLFFGLIGQSGWGQGSENFTNIPTTTSTSYGSRSWTGTNSVTWTATAARTDQTLTGKAICTNGSGKVTSPSYANGIGTLQFNYVRGFTGTGARSIDVYVNSVKQGSTLTVNASSSTVVAYSSAINISGNIIIELRTSGAQIIIDDIQWNSYSATPTLTAANLSSAISNTYGTASTGVNFTAAGTNLTGNITATAQTGFAVSTTLGSGYTTDVSVATGTTVYVQSTATKAVGTFNGATAVVLSGGGAASSVNITTSASGNVVSTKGLTITGLSAADKNYDGNTTVSVTGTAAYSGLENGESFTPSGSFTWAFPDANVGDNKVLTRTGSYAAPSANYTVTQPSLTASILAVTPSEPTITSITPGNALLSVAFTAASTNGGASITNYEYSINNGSLFTACSPLQTASPIIINGLTNGTIYDVQIRAVNSAGSGTASTAVQGTPTAPTTPTIFGAATAIAFTTTYGTASAAQSFAISGSALEADIIATAPTGFEVSSDGTSYGTTATFSQSSGTASGTLRIRLKVGATVTGTNYNSVTIQLTSTNATTVNITTASSGNSVATKALTITGISISNKVYDGNTTATILGTAIYSGLVSGDNSIVNDSPTAVFANKTVANAKAVTVSGYTAPSANYSITQPTGLTANITAATLTLTSASVTSRTYNGTTAATITGTLSGIIPSDVVTLNGTGTFASANAGTGISVTSTSTLGGADAGNYTLTQPTGLTGTISQATQTITFTSFTTPITSSTQIVANSNVGGAITFSSSNSSVATINSSTGVVAISGNGTTTITASNAGNSNYTAASTSQVLTVNSSTVVTLLTWNTFGNAGTETTESSTSNTNVASSTLSLGAGVNAASNGNRFGGSDWFKTGNTNPSLLSEAITANSYIEFTVTPTTGYSITPTSFEFILDFSGTGPSSVALRSSADNYATNLGTLTGMIASTTLFKTLSIAGLSNITSTTTFRLYGYAATATGGTGGFDCASSQNNVLLKGTVSCTTPSQSSAISGTTTVCSGSAQTYSVTTVSGTGYSWSLPGGSWSGSSISNSITANVGSAGGTISVTPYNAASGCTNYTASSQNISVSVNTTPTITATTADSRCDAGIVTLGATASAGTINWYAASSAGSSLGTGTSFTTPSISSNTTYYVDATANSCTTGSRTAVTATVNTTPIAPTGSASQSFCSANSPTVESLVATGTAIKWYDASSNGNLLASNSALTTGTYYASQTVSGCESTTRTAATVSLINSGTWTGGSSSWSSAANWCGGIPTASTNVVISSGSPILDVNHTIASGSSLTLSGTATLTINPDSILTIAGTADFGGKSVIIKSDASGDGAIGQVTGTLSNATSVTVERYIPARRAWRALTAPLKGSNTSLFASWQNNGSTIANTGVALWGPSGTGMVNGPAYNIRQYTTSGWADVTNTQSANLFSSTANNAYMVFVTGAYGSNNITNGGSDPTTLKATGHLITGTVSFPITSTRHTLVGNPFASPLSPSAILAGNTQANLFTNIWMWDPAISSNGAYVNYDASINSGTFSDNSGSYSSSTTAIQSGQAFFVRAVANTDTLTLTEAMKSSSVSNTFRNSNSISTSVFRIGFAKQIGTEWMPLDGAIAAFYDSANASVDPADGTKMVNSAENMALVRGTTNLSIEHYPLVNATDQLNVKIWNTQQAHYKLKLNTEEFTMVGVEAFLQDLYTGTTQPLNLDGSVQDYEFDVDPTVSASSGNRFRIVFTNTALAVTNPEQGQLSIYPNPATGGKVTVSLPTGNFEGCSYELINVLGQVVRQDEIANGNSSQVLIPLTGLPNSWYALRIRKNNKVVYQGKLIINN